MLDDILLTIEERAEEESQKILSQKKEKLLALEKSYQQDLAKKQSQVNKEAEENIALEIAEAKKQKELAVSFALQAKRSQIVEEIYQSVCKKADQLPESDLSKMIEKVLERYSLKKIDGHLEAGKKTSGILAKKGLSVDKELANEEGFILRTAQFEIDSRMRELVKGLREKTDCQVFNILFN